MSPSYKIVQQRIDEIETEMRRANLWQETPLPPEAYRFTEAFGADTMPFLQWLQFIFIPRVRQIVAEKGEFPSQSMVAAQACREFDTEPGDTSKLLTLLSKFDDLFSR